MESAVLDQVTVDIASADKTVQLRATGSVVNFDGFLTLYDEDKDETAPTLTRKATPSCPPSRGRGPGAPRRHPRAAFHPAAAALHRGEPGQEARGARHRPALDLCQHHRSAAGPGLREARPQALHAGGPRPHRHRLPADLLPALRRIRLHRPSRGRARRDLRRQDRLEAGAARVLEGLLRRRRRDQGPARQRGDRQARRGARPPLLPGQRRWRQDPARLPVLRQRPARPEARQVRRLHRLLELSRVPLHPQLGSSIPTPTPPRAPTSTGRRCSAPIRRPARS